jgi:hypothetical protein
LIQMCYHRRARAGAPCSGGSVSGSTVTSVYDDEGGGDVGRGGDDGDGNDDTVGEGDEVSDGGTDEGGDPDGEGGEEDADEPYVQVGDEPPVDGAMTLSSDDDHDLDELEDALGDVVLE